MELRVQKFNENDTFTMKDFLKDKHIEKDEIYKIDIIPHGSTYYSVLIWYWVI
jgi:hypothetical protein